MAEGGALILATQFPLKALLSVGCLLPACSLQKINEGDDRLVTYFSLISITPAIKLPKNTHIGLYSPAQSPKKVRNFCSLNVMATPHHQVYYEIKLVEVKMQVVLQIAP